MDNRARRRQGTGAEGRRANQDTGFNDKYAQNDETGAFTLKADGCCSRFKMSRLDELRTPVENSRSNHISRVARDKSMFPMNGADDMPISAFLNQIRSYHVYPTEIM